MTNHAPRLYALALAVLVFFLTWAVISARPWAQEVAPSATSLPDGSELAALQARERALRKKIALVRNQQRTEAAQAASLPAQAAAAPAQVVSTPPATVTRSS
jgi:hypothetical protein